MSAARSFEQNMNNNIRNNSHLLSLLLQLTVKIFAIPQFFPDANTRQTSLVLKVILIHYWTLDIPTHSNFEYLGNWEKLSYFNTAQLQRLKSRQLSTRRRRGKISDERFEEGEKRVEDLGWYEERSGQVDGGRPITENKISHGTLVATYLWKISNSILDFPPKTGVQGRSEPPAASLMLKNCLLCCGGSAYVLCSMRS